MGSASGAEDEKPVRRIFVSEFYIAKYPVSNADYRRFVLAAGHRPPSSKEKGRPLWNGEDFLAQIGRQPVVRVSWDDAVAYCRWLSRATGKQYRLPTEAEREKAARGGLEQKKYPWGDEEPDEASAWFGKQWSGLLTLKDVDYGVANGYGLYGLAGNVNEWVADLYNAHAYAHSSPRDPQGPFGGLDRVVRGGSAFDEARRLRCAARGFKTPTERTLEVGFRVARNQSRQHHWPIDKAPRRSVCRPQRERAQRKPIRLDWLTGRSRFRVVVVTWLRSDSKEPPRITLAPAGTSTFIALPGYRL
jgi:formylglycine-generating enzyme required for sulfatase activity